MEKKLLHFDETAFKQAESELSLLVNSANELKEFWISQPILESEPFSKLHFESLLNGKGEYLRETVKGLMKAGFAKVSTGFANQMNMDVFPIEFDSIKLNRLIENLLSNPNRKYTHHAMVDFDEKGEPFVSEGTKEQIREACSLYANDEQAEIFKAGLKAEKAISELQTLLKKRDNARMEKSSFSMPSNTKLFAKKSDFNPANPSKAALIETHEGIKFNLKIL